MKLVMLLATFMMLTVYPLVGTGKAQSKQSDRESAAESGKQTTVTGCLQKGDEANEYKLTSSDGKTYELVGSNLAPHVGHTITVTGSSTSEESSEKGEMGSSRRSEASEGARLKVSKVQMVSNSCK
jgi:hypothetical protein